EKFGADDLKTLNARDDLASTLELVGRYQDAKEIATDVLERSKVLMGEEHPSTVGSMAHLANILLKLNDREQALELARRAYDTAMAQLGDANKTTKSARSVLAACLISYARLDDAASLYEQRFPRDPGIVKTFQGSPEILSTGPQMLVMWETWCPFSQRLVPMAEELFRRHQEAGLGVVGLTRVTRSSSDERVELYIRERQLSFPVYKENGKSWSYFEATGTPYVVMLVDGRVVWKGSGDTAADLSDRLVRELMTAY
ncbi:MAG: tetratricopeptide repeat protein, partial [Candidatus Krumholzibacteria bacterium]|nr:tetratricopeptide repeat protein [Candidatus Krumholzibacteria bacterium]